MRWHLFGGPAVLTDLYILRRTKLHPQKQRSKYICKPEAVVEAGNHFVWELIPGRGSLNVPVDAAILHHYRVWKCINCLKHQTASSYFLVEFYHSQGSNIAIMPFTHYPVPFYTRSANSEAMIASKPHRPSTGRPIDSGRSWSIASSCNTTS